MHEAPVGPVRFRFAEFEFCPGTGELRSGDRTFLLPDQAGRVLEALLAANGELVSRDELRSLLWPEKAYGDFEGGLNAAVRKLRQALGDDGAEPRLVGTLPRRGYRLLVPAVPLGPAVPETPRAGGRRRPWWAAGLAVLVLAGSLGLWLHGRTRRYVQGRFPGEVWNDPSTGLAFVWIPAGTFLMGSPPEERGRGTDENQHQVTLSRGFWLGRYEVTQGQFEAMAGTNPSRFKASGPLAPVENVGWEDAQAFLRRLDARVRDRSYRLPTEAEWEYACRAGTTGSTYGPAGAIAWNAYTSGLRTHPVGQKQPNAWGLYDMIGNVCEWCQDCYRDPYDTSVDTDPVGPQGYHAARGGSWQSGATQSRSAHRASERDFEIPYPVTGFRVVCVPDLIP